MKIVRVIARLNVGGPAKHVAWLTAGLQDGEWESLLVAGSVPPGERTWVILRKDSVCAAFVEGDES